jgi:GT2 family glycosyltransferase
MKIPHITVCICTFQREELLRRLLDKLEGQQTDDLFTYSVVVADNDSAQSAKQVLERFWSSSGIEIAYCVEPRQNIARARNKAVETAKGDLIAFIDDDEFPENSWLLNLFKALQEYAVDGVLGPVLPHFDSEPPTWVKKGKFFERPNHATGYKITWPEARSGNVLFKKSILDDFDVPFRPDFATGGEDVDFFRRAMEKGFIFVWCSEAVVHEVVPPSRCRRSYLLKRALLRGSNSAKYPKHRIRNLTRSVIAVPVYVVALPILMMFGQHLFLRYVIRLLDHAARLLAFLGLHPVTKREM